jgi:large subunit ribosomal protein L2
MGKPIIAQKRGKGSTAYRAPSFNFKGKASHPPLQQGDMEGTIAHFATCRAHSAPLAFVEFNNGHVGIMLAPEGVRIGQTINVGIGEPTTGNTMSLVDIPEGTLVYNIELNPGDGGKFVRASGTFARIQSKTAAGVTVRMPSKKIKLFNNNCRATVGVLAGGGRLEKPLLKAGNMYYKRKSRNQLFPIVSASAMNAVDHPYGNKRTSRKSKAKPVSRNAPPGRKVGMVAARRTGRKKK